MESRLPCNAFYKYLGLKYPVHIDRGGQWWSLDGRYIIRLGQMTLTSSVAEVDDRPAWALHVLNTAFIQREAEALGRERRHDEELRRLARWERIRERILDDL